MGKQPSGLDVSFKPKQAFDTSSDITKQFERQSIATSSSSRSKKVYLSTEERELQTIIRKRELKALEKQQADKYFTKIKNHSLKPKYSIVKESTKT
jgi:hypothetical protein